MIKTLEWFSILLILIALARPLLGKGEERVQRKGMDVVIAVDTSASMLAEDFLPNRLQKAKQELVDLLEQMAGNRVGLIAFSGDVATLCPLTFDVAALKIYLEILDIELIGHQGTAIGKVIKQALTLFDQGKSSGKAIILLTDGEDQETGPLEAALKAHDKGIHIYTIGIGALSPEPIPVFDESGKRVGHKRNLKGEVILTKLNEGILQEIAGKTGGKYFRATSGGMEIKEIFKEVNRLERGELGEAVVTQYEERFQGPLLMAIFLIILCDLIGERKGSFRQVKNEWLKRRVA